MCGSVGFHAAVLGNAKTCTVAEPPTNEERGEDRSGSSSRTPRDPGCFALFLKYRPYLRLLNMLLKSKQSLTFFDVLPNLFVLLETELPTTRGESVAPMMPPAAAQKLPERKKKKRGGAIFLFLYHVWRALT